MGMPMSVTGMIVVFGGASEYGDGSNFEVMLGQKLNHSVKNFVTLCYVIPL
jgi:hypothetical protein